MNLLQCARVFFEAKECLNYLRCWANSLRSAIRLLRTSIGVFNSAPIGNLIHLDSMGEVSVMLVAKQLRKLFRISPTTTRRGWVKGAPK